MSFIIIINDNALIPMKNHYTLNPIYQLMRRNNAQHLMKRIKNEFPAELIVLPLGGLSRDR